MRSQNKVSVPWRFLLSMSVLVALSACAPSKSDLTPTLSVEQIFTAAFETLQSQQATALALTPPTATASLTPLPTLPPASPIPTLALLPTVPVVGGGGGCDNAAYVADVTIPDNTVVSAGKTFDKTWTIQNTGSCAWNTGYKLAFLSGEQMGGAAASVPTTVPSGGQVNITVKLTAPSTAGTYTGWWRMQNDKGLGFGGSVTVVIKVGSGGGPTATKGPTLSPADLTGTASAIPTAGATVTISGKTGAASVNIHWEGKGIDMTQEFSGTWSIVVPAHWDGTVTPSKGNVNKWTFSPEFYTYTDVTTNKFNQDFVATPP